MKTSQRLEVLAYIEKNGSITHREAEEEIGCMRLAARINELRKAGYSIKMEMVLGRNRHNEPVRYARYSKAV